MSETHNTSAIAGKIQNDIFKVFHWNVHSQEDSDFQCVLEEHLTDAGERKKTHPGDIVFHYVDPYLDKTICLHTDLKSYGKSSIRQNKIREALTSLAMTIECASVTDTWRTKFSSQTDTYEVRGLLFVANHDNKAPARFRELLKGIALKNIPVAKNQIIHILGPDDVARLFSIATDIKLAIQDKKISPHYRFFYPDLTLWKRTTGEDERTGATIEMLLSPHFVLKHHAVTENNITIEKRGSLVYYGRKGETIEEFIYLLDTLSRYQLVNSHEQLRIRAFNPESSSNIKNNFDIAKKRYCQIWKFDSGREMEVNAITIDSINQISPNYKADEIGWKE